MIFGLVLAGVQKLMAVDNLQNSGVRSRRIFFKHQFSQGPTGKLQVQSIRTEFDVLVQCDRLVSSDSNFREVAFVVPVPEDSPSDQVRKIHFTFDAV